MKKFTLLCWLALSAVLLALPAGAGAVVAKADTVADVGSLHVFVLTEGNASAAAQVDALVKGTQRTKPRIIIEDSANSADLFRRAGARKPLEVKPRFNAVVLLNTLGEVFNAEEQAAYESYFRAGGSLVGIGSAIETSPTWQFLTDVLGTRAVGKLDAQTVTNKPTDRGHDASKNLPEYWDLNDTYYNFAANVRGLSHILTTVSAAPFTRTGDGPTLTALTGSTMGADHPVTWCKDYQGGRSYYTNHGASTAAWSDANLAKELIGALNWAAGQSDPVYSDCGATVRANYQQSFVAAPPNLSEPIGFDVLPDGSGRVIQTDRRGGVRLHDPSTNSTTCLNLSDADGDPATPATCGFTWVVPPAPTTLPTSLAAASLVGDTNIKVVSTAGLTAGDTFTLDTGADSETATIQTVGGAGATGTGLTLRAPLTKAHALAAAVTVVSQRKGVYIVNEDGMYGPEVDNNFNTNKWVYLFYSPPEVKGVKFADGTLHDVTTPTNAAPNTAAALSAWDNYVGYFQLSRFKFVDAAGGVPAHIDFASEQQIMRQMVNRGACCHVAGDIDFDSKNNLWMVTGDDTPAGGGNSGGFGPFNGMLTNESQTVAVGGGATGGTFTLTFDGQTTTPIAFPLDNAAIEAALEALSNIDDVAVTGTGTRTVNFRANQSERDVPQMTGDASGLTGGTPTLTIATTAAGGLFNAPHVDARRGAQNTGDLRGKLLRIKVKDGDITAAEQNAIGGAYSVPAGNLFPAGTARTRPEIYAMGFRNPFRLTLDKNDVAYVSDYSPDSNTPSQFRGPAGTGRFEIVRKPANYGWPLCYKTDLPYYKWDFNTSTPLPSAAAPEPHECNNPARGPQNTSRWAANGGPAVDPGLEYGPPITNPEIWYSYNDNNAANPLGTPCFGYYGPNALTDPDAPGSTTPCPRLFPELFTGGVGPHGTAPYDYDPANPNPTKFPPYWDGAWIAGEFTQDTLREVRMDSNNAIHKINNTLPCGPVPATPTRPWLCDNPMDMEFGPDGTFYLLTYGDGFFAINADAGMMRWEYVKGLRAPIVSITATPTSGPTPLTVAFTSTASDPDPADSIRYEWDFDGNGTVDSIEANPTHTYTVRGQYTAKVTVFDSSGKSASANTTITVGNTAPVVTVNVPVDGGTFAFGDNIPFTVSVVDVNDGAINCSEVQVTFVLGHDTHGHAEATTTGCSGVLPTIADDASHGGNVFGVISASYTDHGGAGGVPSLTTVTQVQIRQKRNEVENVLNQSGTNTATSTDVGGGLQRGSLSAGDWMELNGPFNLLNINALTFRVTGGTNGAASGTVELWRDAINTAGGGTLVSSQTITGTAAGTHASQTFPLTNPGGAHRLFLVFPNANTYSLNWVEFVGPGVGTP